MKLPQENFHGATLKILKKHHCTKLVYTDGKTFVVLLKTAKTVKV